MTNEPTDYPVESLEAQAASFRHLYEQITLNVPPTPIDQAAYRSLYLDASAPAAIDESTDHPVGPDEQVHYIGDMCNPAHKRADPGYPLDDDRVHFVGDTCNPKHESTNPERFQSIAPQPQRGCVLGPDASQAQDIPPHEFRRQFQEGSFVDVCVRGCGKPKSDPIHECWCTNKPADEWERHPKCPIHGDAARQREIAQHLTEIEGRASPIELSGASVLGRDKQYKSPDLYDSGVPESDVESGTADCMICGAPQPVVTAVYLRRLLMHWWLLLRSQLPFLKQQCP